MQFGQNRNTLKAAGKNGMVAEKIRSIENSSEACLLALGYSEP
jgi:hypothetical protein